MLIHNICLVVCWRLLRNWLLYYTYGSISCLCFFRFTISSSFLFFRVSISPRLCSSTWRSVSFASIMSSRFLLVHKYCCFLFTISMSSSSPYSRRTWSPWCCSKTAIRAKLAGGRGKLEYDALHSLQTRSIGYSIPLWKSGRVMQLLHIECPHDRTRGVWCLLLVYCFLHPKHVAMLPVTRLLLLISTSALHALN